MNVQIGDIKSLIASATDGMRVSGGPRLVHKAFADIGYYSPSAATKLGILQAGKIYFGTIRTQRLNATLAVKVLQADGSTATTLETLKATASTEYRVDDLENRLFTYLEEGSNGTYAGFCDFIGYEFDLEQPTLETEGGQSLSTEDGERITL